jgi:hypothetical protein
MKGSDRTGRLISFTGTPVNSLEMFTSDDQIIIPRHEPIPKMQRGTDAMPCQLPRYWNPRMIPATE